MLNFWCEQLYRSEKKYPSQATWLALGILQYLSVFARGVRSGLQMWKKCDLSIQQKSEYTRRTDCDPKLGPLPLCRPFAHAQPNHSQKDPPKTLLVSSAKGLNKWKVSLPPVRLATCLEHVFYLFLNLPSKELNNN